MPNIRDSTESFIGPISASQMMLANKNIIIISIKLVLISNSSIQF